MVVGAFDNNVPRKQTNLCADLCLAAASVFTELGLGQAILFTEHWVEFLRQVPVDQWSVQKDGGGWPTPLCFGFKTLLDPGDEALFHLTSVAAIKAAIHDQPVGSSNDNHVAWLPIQIQGSIYCDCPISRKRGDLQLRPSCRDWNAMHLNISSGLEDCLCAAEWQLESVPMTMQCDLPPHCVGLRLAADEELTSVHHNCLCLHVNVLEHIPNHIAFDHPEADVHIHV
mmetsp:Transcript_21603/g.37694  ORF Transcript_21603/g.37694 Transcript_21603/m.37694 type:complete len:227 (+) Transcript_21603:1156-1836(+)